MLARFPVYDMGGQNAFAHPFFRPVPPATGALLKAGIVKSRLGRADIENGVLANAVRAAGRGAVHLLVRTSLDD